MQINHRNIFYKTMGWLVILSMFLTSNGLFAKDTKLPRSDRADRLEKELENIKRELSTIKKEFSTFKEESKKDKENPAPAKETNPSIVAPVTPIETTGTKSLKKYEIKSKGMKIQDLEDNAGKRYAITIGVNNYQDTGISALTKARNDAKIAGKILKEQGQFDQVFVMTDDVDPRNDKDNLYPTKLNIEEKIDSVLRFSNPEDLIVFFFSGHGISDPEENGYLVAVDTITDKQFNTSVRVQDIVAKLKSKSIKKSLLILDACRDVLYTTKSNSRNSILEKEYTEAEVAATFYSTKAGYFSFEDDETDYGVFTKYLVMGMEGKADVNEDGIVAFSELEQFVQKGVKEWSTKKNKQQKPFTRLHGEKTGDLAITFAPDKDKPSLVDKPIPKVVTRSDMIFRSTFLPGWGQRYAGAKLKGNIYTGVFAGLFGYFAFNLLAMNKAQSEYNSTLVLPGTAAFYPTYFQLQNAHSHLQETSQQTTTAFGLLTAFWIWNIVDAGAFTNLPKQEFFSLGVTPRKPPLEANTLGQGKSEQYGYVHFTWKF